MLVQGQKVSDADIVEMVWHWKIEDGIDNWEFCAGIVAQDLHVDLSLVSPQDVENAFMRYFQRAGDVELYKHCPQCADGILTPRKSRYGYFVGCSCYPKCDYKVALNRRIK